MRRGVAEQLTETVTLYCGDCLDVLKTLEADSVDSCVTDPPYHLTNPASKSNMHDKTFVDPNAKQFVRLTKGFMGKTWDGGDIAFRPDVWREVWRVLKPGAHLLAFGGTRTYHRMACAVEDAGFEIRDCVQWLYGSGFPKSHNITIAIDKTAGVAPRSKAFNMKGRGDREDELNDNGREFLLPYEPATAAAREWQGFGTALKPACELIVLARKPLSESTVAANVLKWGTGALNIDGCRVATNEQITTTRNYLGGAIEPGGMEKPGNRTFTQYRQNSNGRWPANLIHDGSEEVVAGFPDARSYCNNLDTANAASGKQFKNNDRDVPILPEDGYFIRGQMYADAGSAARFFYTAKADADDRLGSRHPTVKPLDLKQYLVRLVTPPGGLVLDCFAGTGTTGEAAWREGMRAVLIEREAEYQEDIRRRMRLALGSARERRHESVKARMKDKPVDHGPLFAASPP